MTQSATAAEPLRRLVLALLLLSMLGTCVELLLLGHTEGALQWIPIALLGLGVLVLGWTAVSPRAARIKIFRSLMALFVVAGVAGLVLHYRNNVEFELEMYPSASGWALFSGAMSGALPALAPGVMIQIGLLGFAYTFRHPALASPTHNEVKQSGEYR